MGGAEWGLSLSFVIVCIIVELQSKKVTAYIQYSVRMFLTKHINEDMTNIEHFHYS